MKNKRGATIFFLLMMGTIFFLLGLSLTPVIMESINEATDKPYFNCTAGNETLTDQRKAECTSIEIQQFLFIGVIFGLAGLILAGALR